MTNVQQDKSQFGISSFYTYGLCEFQWPRRNGALHGVLLLLLSLHTSQPSTRTLRLLPLSARTIQRRSPGTRQRRGSIIRSVFGTTAERFPGTDGQHVATGVWISVSVEKSGELSVGTFLLSFLVVSFGSYHLRVYPAERERATPLFT
jgi:hypothetical protein